MPFTTLTRPRVPAALAAALALAACAPSRPVSAPLPAPAPVVEREELGDSPEVEESVSAPKRDILGSVRYDLPVEANSWVESELDFLVQQRSAVIGRWLERGDFYEPFIKEELRAHELPTDLFHLAMIESGFVPTARSRAGAVGLWQFMPATGRAMGLQVDSLVDERMDPVRSTRAAARHLRSLRRSLGDWALAAAAYNAGSGRITRGMRAFGVSNFWDLAQKGDLAEETKHYVPRLYAVTVIGRDRARFGFSAPDTTRRFAFDSVFVEYATPLDELARLSEVEAESLTRLNPHLLRGITPGGGYWVWVPAGKGAQVQRAWLASDFRKEQGYGTYVVRWGDNLSTLAELSGLRAARIRELNPRVDFDRLRTGEKLRLPFRVAQQLAERPARTEEAPRERRAAEPVVARRAEAPRSTPDQAARTHTVADGETLWGIARRYGVEVAALQRENSLSGETIRSGQRLRVPAGAAEPTPAPAPAPATVEHVVEAGESLWGIARKYGSTVTAIQSANQLNDRPIRPGQKLVVPRADDAR